MAKKALEPAPQIKEQLHSEGLRATPQRLLVMQILKNSSERHLDAEAIWSQARDYDPNLSLATTYRTLNALKKKGLIDQRYFSRDHKREFYESATSEHYHFTCLECGRVIELSTHRINQARTELSQQQNLEITKACICFEGYCADCLNQKELP